jgi:uncharacterized repeat protein (TIGR03803 family)
LVQGVDGNLYGTTYFGGIGYTNGNPDSGYGTVFKVTTNGVLTTLAFFNGANGSNPDQSLVQGRDGSFYGTTDSGGADTNINQAGGWNFVGHGTVFKMTPDGTLTTLVSFDTTNGGGAVSGLMQGIDGKLYGITQSGGTNHFGTIFQVTTNGALAIVATLDGTNAAYPLCLAQAADGVFYCGTHGSFPPPYAAANIFQLPAPGTVTPLFSFGYSATPSTLMQAADGNFYGTTQPGGMNPSENLFRMSVPVAPYLKTTAQSPGALTFTWNAVAGQTYQVQYSTDPALTNWTNLGGSFTATNGVVSTSDRTDADSHRLYRVVSIP